MPTDRRVSRCLASHGETYELHRHAEVRTIAEAQDTVPHLVDGLLKTVAFTIKDSPRILLVAIDCRRQVDYRAVATAAGCSRRALRLLSADRIEAELGFEVGGVGPFPVTPAAEVWIDADIPSSRRVRVGAGLRSETLELTCDALLRCSGGRRASLSKMFEP